MERQARIEEDVEHVEITSLRRYGERGWEWTATLPDPTGGTMTVWCRTNGHGRGLASRDPSGAEPWVQTRGMLQFGLPDDEESARYYICRHHAETMNP